MKEIKLTRGYVAQVNDEDFEWLNQWKWCASGKDGQCYAMRGGGTKKKNMWFIFMHRLIMDAPRGLEVDHIDGNRMNNQRSNLRVCTHRQNSRNRKSYGGSSIYIGVSRYRCHWRAIRTGDWSYDKWAANICVNGKDKFLGYYKDEKEAAMAYDRAALKYFEEFARLNFPEMRNEYLCSNNTQYDHESKPL